MNVVNQSSSDHVAHDQTLNMSNEAEFAKRVVYLTPACVSYIGKDYRYKLASRYYEWYFQRPIESIIGRKVYEIIGESSWQVVKPALDRALAGEPSVFDVELAVPGRGLRWSHGTYTPDFDSEGKARGVTAHLVDITDRKGFEHALQKTSAYYHSIFSAPIVGNAEVDLHTKCFLKVNRTMHEMLGYTEEEIVGKLTVFDITHPDDVDVNKDAIQPLMMGEASYVALDKRYIRKDGSVIWVRVAGTVLRGVDSPPDRIFSTVEDISARKFAEERLKEEERRKDRFLATLSHELRNPLAAISNALQIWTRLGNNSAAVGQLQDMMQRQVAQLKHLVDDLLDISRISTGAIHLRREQVELAEVLASALETSKPHLDKHRQVVCFNAAEALITVYADRVRLVQVFSNLISNAARYSSPETTITISVSTTSHQTTITVSDQGLGISADMLKNIFLPFVQVDATLERSQSGLGIGLALTKELVELHEGTIAATSDGIGRGSTFIVRLPLGSAGRKRKEQQERSKKGKRGRRE